MLRSVPSVLREFLLLMTSYGSHVISVVSISGVSVFIVRNFTNSQQLVTDNVCLPVVH